LPLLPNAGISDIYHHPWVDCGVLSIFFMKDVALGKFLNLFEPQLLQL
jgi:hypothetical protein